MNAQPNNRIHAGPELQAGGSSAATPLEGFCGLLAETVAKYSEPETKPLATGQSAPKSAAAEG